MNELRFLADFMADVFDAIETSIDFFGFDNCPKHEPKRECCCKKHHSDCNDFNRIVFNKEFGVCHCKNTPGKRSPFFKDECKERKPLRPWGVAEVEPKEDPNKVFGINIRVDEPKRSWYNNRRDFEKDHAKFDRLVDAAEDCNWENKSNDAPLHKVNCIRRRVEDGPPTYFNIIGETEWF